MTLLKDKTYVGNWRLEQAIQCIGPAAIPPLVSALEDTDLVVRVRVAGTLSRFGEKGAAAVPVLIEGLQHKDVRVRRSGIFYLTEMGALGKAALPDLIDLLKDDDRAVRRDAIQAVVRMGKGSEQATSALIQALGQADLRESAAIGLATIEAKEAVPALVQQLGDEAVAFRVKVCWAIA